MSGQSPDPSAEDGGIPWLERDGQARFRRWRRLAARYVGWVGGAPVRHSVDDRSRSGFRRCAPWGRSRRFDHTHPWHRRDWLRQIADEAADD